MFYHDRVLAQFRLGQSQKQVLEADRLVVAHTVVEAPVVVVGAALAVARTQEAAGLTVVDVALAAVHTAEADQVEEGVGAVPVGPIHR